MNQDSILTIRDLVIQFHLRGRTLTAIRGVSLDVPREQTLAIVGESGSGKSVLVKNLVGMLDPNGRIIDGVIKYEGREIQSLTEKEWMKVRGREIAMIFQDPMTALNPLKTIGKQIQESIEHNQGIKGDKAKKMVYEILKEVGISNPERRYKQYPFEFSGGMRQRVVIAVAIACNPKVLICDEPTTALDVTIQAQILNLLMDLKEKLGLTIIFITHDLGVVARIADKVAVMYAGDVVEIGQVDEIFFDPRHPYTWALLSSLPQLGIKGEALYSIKGTPPNLFMDIQGDAFAPRNPQALKIDFVERPPYFEVSPTHIVKSWLEDDRAPDIKPPAQIAKLQEESEELHG